MGSCGDQNLDEGCKFTTLEPSLALESWNLLTFTKPGILPVRSPLTGSHLYLSGCTSQRLWAVFLFTIRKAHSVGSAQLSGTCRTKLVAEEGCHLKGTPAQFLLSPTSPVNMPRHFTCLSCYFRDLGVGWVKTVGTVQDTEASTHLHPSNRQNWTRVSWQRGWTLSAPLLLSSCATQATLTLAFFIGSTGSHPSHD